MRSRLLAEGKKLLCRDKKLKLGGHFQTSVDRKITKFMNEINERPRKKLNFLTPKECFLQKHFVILHLLVEFAVKYRKVLE